MADETSPRGRLTNLRRDSTMDIITSNITIRLPRGLEPVQPAERQARIFPDVLHVGITNSEVGSVGAVGPLVKKNGQPSKTQASVYWHAWAPETWPDWVTEHVLKVQRLIEIGRAWGIPDLIDGDGDRWVHVAPGRYQAQGRPQGVIFTKAQIEQTYGLKESDR